MGVIYRARQCGLNRTVALKMISSGACAGPADRARFRTEAEAAARLRHPNVVQVYEVGSARGMPYLALEYMEGGSLAQRLGGKPLPPREAAALVELLGRAVHAAHEHGVVHRDLKPANVLFACGVPKVSDFGLAKDLAGAGQTSTGAVVGTPGYMAPEQADGRARHVGPGADVYALGAILYECLTGRPPFKGETALETLLQVRTREPVPPGRLRPGLPRDLATVCLKALAKEPGRRYAGADDLADDLRRFLDGRPVSARPVAAWERAWRRCRRHPALTASLAAAALSLAAAVAVGGVAALVRGERDLAVAARGRAEQEQARAEAAERQLEIRSHLYRAAAYRRSGQAGQRFRCLAELRQALALGPSPEQRREIRDEAAAALVLPDLEVAAEWDGWPDGTVNLDFDDDFRRYARLASDGTVTVYRLDGSSAAEVARFAAEGSAPFVRLWLSPDGDFVVVAHAARGNPPRQALTVWRLDWERPGLAPLPVLKDDRASGFCTTDFFACGGSRCLALNDGTALRAYDLVTGVRLWEAPLGGGAHSAAVRPGGDTVAVVWGSEVLLFDAATGRERRRLSHADLKVRGIWSLAWHPDGRRLATACDDRRIHLWDAEKGELLPGAWEGHFDQGIQVAFNHAGDRLVSYDWSRQTQLWDAASGRPLLTLPGPVAPRFGRGDDLLGPQYVGKLLRLWRVAAGRELRVLRHPAAGNRPFVRHPVLDGSGRVVAAVTPDGISFFDPAGGEELAAARVPFEGLTCLHGFTPAAGWTLSVNAYPAMYGALSWPGRPDPARPGVLRVGPPRYLSFRGGRGAYASPDGKVLALEEGNSALVVNRDGPTRREFRTGPQRDVRVAAVSPDKRWVATCSWEADPESSVRVWDARTGAVACGLPVRERAAFAWFSPDGRWLFTTAFGQASRLWEVPAWREVRPYEESTVAFTPGPRDSHMALTHGAGQIRLVEPATGREAGRLTGPDPIWYDPVAFTPDGTRLVAAARDFRSLYVWDLRAVREGLRELGLDWDLPPFPPAPPPAPLPRVVVDRGWLAHEADFPDPHDATALFTASLALTPLNPEGYYQRGRAFARQERRQEAVADYSRFLALCPADDPRRGEVLFRRSSNYLLSGDEAAVRRDLLAMAELDLEALPWPAVAAARVHTYASKLAAGPGGSRRSGEALRLSRKALELEPDSGLYRGVELYRLGRWSEAAAVLEVERGQNPDSAGRTLYFLTMCRQRLGEGERARECFASAVRLHEQEMPRLAAEEKADRDACRAEAEAVLRGP
jgi:WD40 repeat protein/tetratricopeptide (TPR) repeat protein